MSFKPFFEYLLSAYVTTKVLATLASLALHVNEKEHKAPPLSFLKTPILAAPSSLLSAPSTLKFNHPFLGGSQAMLGLFFLIIKACQFFDMIL